MDESSDEIGPGMRALRTRADHTLKSLALAMGYKGASSVQRYEEPGAKRENVTLPFIRRAAKALIGRGEEPIDLPDLFFLLEQPPRFDSPLAKAMAYELFGVEVPPAIAREATAVPVPTQRIGVFGSVQASYWRPSSSVIDIASEYLDVPVLPGYPASAQYALKVFGPSMNKVAREGTFVICTRYDSGLKRIKHDKIVHVERERFGEIEWTLKRLKWDGGDAYLWPESDDPDYQEPIEVVPQGEDDVIVRVLGVVVGFYTPAP